MIENKKIIVYTTASNAVSKGYWKVLEPAIESVTKHSFIDEFVVLHGQSDDGTVENLNRLKEKNKKVKPFSSPKWNPSQWTWKILLDQYNFFLKEIMLYVELNDDVIVLYQGSDQVWCDSYANELKETLTNMIKTNHDYVLTPFRKTVNANYLTPIYPYHHTGFSVYSALRIRKGFTYEISGSEDILLTNYPVKRLTHRFMNSSISYDMTFFTKEEIKIKISNHNCGISQREIDDYIKNGFLRKCFSMNLSKIEIKDHPLEMHNLLQNIQDDMFGKSCFEHFKG